MSDSQPASAHRAVFLSYASQDAEAAKRICEALRAASVEVWFDQNELVGGDAWDAKIRKQIADCALFLPMVSAATQARHEGYFRLEWKLAAQRTHMMSGVRAFLLPVVIDETRDTEAHVPEEFRGVQWTRLPGGETPPAFCARINKLLSAEVGPVAPVVDRAPLHRQELQSQRRTSRSWLVPALLVGATAAVALALWQPWKKASLAGVSPVAVATADAPLSEARKVVAHAREILEEGDDSNHETLLLAEELLKKAQALDSTDGEVWAAEAQLSRLMLIVGFDRSLARRELLKQQAERAITLNPKSIEAQIAYAGFLSQTGQAGAAEAVRRLDPLTKLYPSHRALFVALGLACSTAGDADAAARAYDQANALPGGDANALAQKGAQMIWHGRYAEAELALAQAQAIKETGRADVFGLIIKLCWRGDLDGAAAAVERWPAWLRLEPRGAIMASQVWMWRHEPDKAIATLKAVASETWNDTLFTGPKSVLLALAYEMANQPQAAHAEWENAKLVAERQIAEDSTNRAALVYKACALVRLGDSASAEKILREVEQSKDLRSEFWSCAAPSALLRVLLGHGAEVAVKFDTEQRSPRIERASPSPRAALQLNPVFDSIRSTPEFQQWMAAAPAPEDKKEDKTSAASAPAVTEKSLVVLPLENLSPDPENAIFTEGMHTEIVSNLQLISELKVVSRGRALAFKGSTLSVADIAKQLGVANVITGSVRREKDRVRIQLELRRASDDALLWSLPKGDRDLKDTLALQTDVAEQVARVLQARETKGGVEVAAQFMTKDPRAYDLFLPARRTYEAGGQNLERIAQTCEAALALDPNFMSAANLLSVCRTNLARNATDPAERMRQATQGKQWAEAAAKMAPGGAGDGALAYYYTTLERDALRGLALAENQLRALPNNSQSHIYVSFALRGLGRLAEASAEMRRAIELDPTNPNVEGNLAAELSALRQSAEWSEVVARYAAKGGQSSRTGIAISRFDLFGEFLAAGDQEKLSAPMRVTWLWRERKFAEAQALCASELSNGKIDDGTRWLFLCMQADAYSRLGQPNEASLAARAALAAAERLQSVAEVGPSEKPGWLAGALVRNGRGNDAIAAAKRHVEEASPESQLALRWEREIALAKTYAYANHPRECIDLLAKLLRVPSGITVPMLKIEPDWDNVRDDPAFQALLEDPKNSAPL